jgi:hypothetical protein
MGWLQGHAFSNPDWNDLAFPALLAERPRNTQQDVPVV